ncbi:ribosomal protein L25/L23 [Kipferlia bialata]|uniref:Ribosomal protein L25/L23 n=1 Tax=Kipferlia bialata TaxID=797122 RepID=A0A391P827_9EUKA|nr:ribosomal protein L25/L23 [Kipferlia bialata]|eukprot:g12863.t1
MAPQARQTANKVLREGKSQNRKIHTSVHFFRPNTLKLARKPRYQRYIGTAKPHFDEFSMIRKPVNTEASMKMTEEQNVLTFVVSPHATKKQIKHALKKMYAVEIARVNTLIARDGLKKAFVTLAEGVNASEVAAEMGMA